MTIFFLPIVDVGDTTTATNYSWSLCQAKFEVVASVGISLLI